jgi:hypothetical protein
MKISNRWAGLAIVLIATLPLAASDLRSVRATLVAADGSGATMGFVKAAGSGQGGTRILVIGTGLNPSGAYLSLYYDNHQCDVEPYEDDDVIGNYTADVNGLGKTTRMVGDDFDEINSVSIRNASDFSLVACADLHPGKVAKK